MDRQEDKTTFDELGKRMGVKVGVSQATGQPEDTLLEWADASNIPTLQITEPLLSHQVNRKPCYFKILFRVVLLKKY